MENEKAFGILLLQRLRNYIHFGNWVSFFNAITSMKQYEIEKKDPTIRNWGNITNNDPISSIIYEKFEENRFENMQNLNSIYSDIYHGKILTEIEQIPDKKELNDICVFALNNMPGLSHEGKSQKMNDPCFAAQLHEQYTEIGKLFYNKLEPLKHTVYFWFELVYICLSGNLKGHKVPYFDKFDEKKVVADNPSYNAVQEFIQFETNYGFNSNIGRRELQAISENRAYYYNNPLILSEAADRNYYSGTYNGLLLSFELYERSLYYGNIGAAFHCFWNILCMGEVTKNEFEKIPANLRLTGSYGQVEMNVSNEAPETYFQRMKMALTYLKYGATKGNGMCYCSLGNCVLDIIKAYKKHRLSDEAKKHITDCLSTIRALLPNLADSTLEELKFQLYEKGVELKNPNSYVNSSYILMERLKKRFILYSNTPDDPADKKKRGPKKKLREEIIETINVISERLDIAATKHRLPEAAHTIARFLQGYEKSYSDNDCLYYDKNKKSQNKITFNEYMHFFENSYFFNKKPIFITDMLTLASRYAYSGTFSTFSSKQKEKCIKEYEILTVKLRELVNNDQ